GPRPSSDRALPGRQDPAPRGLRPRPHPQPRRLLAALAVVLPVLSAFLPSSFDPQRPVALIAGQGLYPVLTARAIRAAGIPLRLIAFEEETPPELYASFAERDRRRILVGQLGKMLKALQEFDAGYAL